MSTLLTERVNINWEKFPATLSTSFQSLRSDSELCDVTLACFNPFNTDEPSLIRAHKVVLAACSPVLRRLMLEMSGNGILYLSGMETEHVAAVVDFVYRGSVEVEKNNLERFLQVARELKVKGLIAACKQDDEDESNNKRKPSSSPKKAAKKARHEKSEDKNEETTEITLNEEIDINCNDAYWLADEGQSVGDEPVMDSIQEKKETTQRKWTNSSNNFKITKEEVMAKFTYVRGLIYQCNMCDRKIKKHTQYKELRQHLYAVHDSKPAYCYDCTKWYKNNYALKSHKRNYHSLKPAVQ